MKKRPVYLLVGQLPEHREVSGKQTLRDHQAEDRAMSLIRAERSLRKNEIEVDEDRVGDYQQEKQDKTRSPILSIFV